MKNRTALRSYFLSGSIPTETNFHELINSGLNQEEDGIRRAVNGPLELEAQGAGGEMLHLYGSFRDTAALWKIGHKPVLAGAAGVAGLNIADAKASRLFIKADDGSVGIGTDAPAKTLDVVGSIGLRVAGAAWDHLFLHHDGATAFVTAGGAENGLALRVGNTTSGSYDAASQNYKEVMRLLPNGNVGIGVTPDATLELARGTGGRGTLAIQGTARISHFNYSTTEDTYIRGGKATSNVYLNDNGGNVGIGTTAPNARLSISPTAVEAKITLYDGGSLNSHYGFGISDSQLNYHVDGAGSRHVFYAAGKNGNGTELLRIQGNGNVGVGSTSPASKLTVRLSNDGEQGLRVTDGTNNSNIVIQPLAGDTSGFQAINFNGYYSGGEQRFNSSKKRWRVGVDQRGTTDTFFIDSYPSPGFSSFIIGSNGYVGIGTNDPRYPLHVTKVGGDPLPSFKFYNYGGVGGLSSGAIDVSIFATARVVGAEFNALSDRRLKTIIGQSDHAADLALLRRLRITDYTMRDRVQFGDQAFKKIIAQELEEVFPQAVNKNTSFLPDVYASASQVQRQGAALLISLPAGLPEAATAGQRLKLIGPAGEVLATLAEAAAAGSQQLLVAGADSLADTPDEVFVFGLEHADVRTVDYEAVAMLNVSATQALARQVAALHQQTTTLTEQYLAQGTQADELRATLHLLQQQVAGLVSQPVGVAQPA